MISPVSSFQAQIPVFHANEHDHNKNPDDNTNNINKEDTNLALNSTAIESENKTPGEFTKEEQAIIVELKSRDLEVKAHEQAHKSAAGSLATSGPSYTYTTGPNGQRYATSGEVGIDVSAVAGDPAATIQKAQTIRRAALAPASPSGQDRAVASKASAMLHQAISDLAEETAEETKVEKSENKQATEEKQATQDSSEKSDIKEPKPIESGSTAGSLINIAI